MKATVPQDLQVLWQEVDGAFGPLSDAVDAASNVLTAFGEVTGDPNAQAAIIGPKLRETYEEVYERVLALARSHEMQTADPGRRQKSPYDLLSEFSDKLEGLNAIASIAVALNHPGQPRDVRREMRMSYDTGLHVLSLINEHKELTRMVGKMENEAWEKQKAEEVVDV